MNCDYRVQTSFGASSQIRKWLITCLKAVWYWHSFNALVGLCLFLLLLLLSPLLTVITMCLVECSFSLWVWTCCVQIKHWQQYVKFCAVQAWRQCWISCNRASHPELSSLNCMPCTRHWCLQKLHDWILACFVRWVNLLGGNPAAGISTFFKSWQQWRVNVVCSVSIL